MRILEYEGLIREFGFESFFKLIPSYRLGLLLWVLSGLAVFIVICSKKEEISTKPSFKTLLWPSLIFFGLYMNTYGLNDEVAVNLEHSYNLFHHGLFSMSPHKMIGGTVEIIYYLLHTPFAGDLRRLLLANYILGMLFGWLHIFCIWKFWLPENSHKNTLLLSCFALTVPIAVIFSDGFGNVLISLAFILSLSFLKARRERVSLGLGALLPLIRPEGIYLSVINFIAFVFHRKTSKKAVGIGDTMIGFCAPCLSLFVYLAGHQFFYGHWIPTPVLFKSVKLSMLKEFNPAFFVYQMLALLSQPSMMMGVALAIAFFILLLKKNKQFNLEIRMLWVCVLLLAVQFSFFMAGATLLPYLGGVSEMRHGLPFLVTLTLFSLVFVSSMEEVVVADKFHSIVLRPSFFIFCMLYLSALMHGFEGASKNYKNDLGLNRDYAIKVGLFSDRVMPDDFEFSSTEMNFYGLGSDRFVIDLWGYSNRDIANSRICNGMRVRTNPNYFLEQSPELYWMYWVTVHGLKNSDGIESDRELLTVDLTNKDQGNFLGDMEKVMEKYDCFILRDSRSEKTKSPSQIGFLIRKDVSERLDQRLKVEGFAFKRSRDVGEDWIKSYREQKICQYAC